MAKWADYIIIRVRYNKDRNFIDKVQVCEDLGEKLGETNVKEREYIVSLIKDGKKVVTANKNKETRKWENGSKVDIYEKKYIRTDPNGTTADNLGELEEF